MGTWMGTLAENGVLCAAMTHRIKSGWEHWNRVSGVLCVRRISLRVKGESVQDGCNTSVWCRYMGSEESKKLDVAEMRWMSAWSHQAGQNKE